MLNPRRVIRAKRQFVFPRKVCIGLRIGLVIEDSVKLFHHATAIP